MATAPNEQPQHPALPTIRRTSSPSPDTVLTLAVKGGPEVASAELSRCLSTASSLSHGSATTDASSLLSLGFVGRDVRDSRDSLGSDASSSAFSRQSSGSYSTTTSSLFASSPENRLSMASAITTTTTASSGHPAEQRSSKRRGYMRPQATDFAASARSRESVLSLGSITHLQHYFARTGLLDLKGQLERRRRDKARTLDLSQLEGASDIAASAHSTSGGSGHSLTVHSDVDSSYAPMGSPDLVAAHATSGPLVESPIQENLDDDWYAEDYDSADVLPPTVSTYNVREKPLPKPPSLTELRTDLKNSLDSATIALAEAREAKTSQAGPTTPASSAPPSPARPPPANSPNGEAAVTRVPTWYEIQGMHILDVITLAIRAAKMYYTSHEQPDRLDAIKSEREVRSELLGVMDVLKRMATRNFAGGIRTEELRAMDAWIASLNAMLDAEDAMVAAERAEQASWTWSKDAEWPAAATVDPARAYARERAFLETILQSGSAPEDKVDTTLPEWAPLDRAASPVTPTPFLRHMQNGVCLVQLHNCAVRKSRSRFGAIPSFHSDTQKPYRAADNLRFWVKAGELRWEVLLKIDALGVVCNSRPDVWPAFEDAIYQWCRKVRQDLTADMV